MKIGIIGGLGPQSTLDYYNQIVNKYYNIKNTYPNLTIESVNMDLFLGRLSNKEDDLAAKVIVDGLINLYNANCTIAAISSNTPHILFSIIVEQSPIKLISIIESTISYIINMNYKNVLILGTRFTMESRLYSNEFVKNGINPVDLSNEDMEIVSNIIFPNLENGIVIKEDKDKIIKLVNKYIDNNQVDSVLLGCTELPLILKDGDIKKPLINTAMVHIDSIVNLMK